jgi:uncharacterized membrane protein
MFQFPPIPNWDALHPLIVHFPIALLLVAPLFIVAALLASPARGRLFMISALILMILGTASVYLAVGTGEAAGELAEGRPQVTAALERHEHLAKESRITFTVLTVLLAAIVFIPWLFKIHPRRISSVIASVVFVTIYCGPAVLLINTAHHGGLLVHKLGVTAPMSVPSQAAPQLGAEPDRD